MWGKAGTESIRWENRGYILSSLRQPQVSSHTDICHDTGLSSASVSAITSDLVAEEVILREEKTIVGQRGRPKTVFQHNPEFAYVVIIRITFDQIEFSLVDYNAVLLDRFSHRREHVPDISIFIQHLNQGLEQILDRSKIAKNRLKMLSISTKGVVDRKSAKLLWSPVFGENVIDFKQVFNDQNVRIDLRNETVYTGQSLIKNSDASEENSNNFQTCVTLSLDNSIGLAISDKSNPHRITSVAPSFAHMVHNPDGPLCRCGLKGCIEAYSGFHGILRIAFDAPDNVASNKFVPMTQIDLIARDAYSGNRQAEYAFRQAGEVLGLGMSRLQSLYGFMPIFITGPGAKFFELMRHSFEEALKNNFEYRFARDLTCIVVEDEENLIFDGSVLRAISTLDSDIIARGDV